MKEYPRTEQVCNARRVLMGSFQYGSVRRGLQDSRVESQVESLKLTRLERRKTRPAHN